MLACLTIIKKIHMSYLHIAEKNSIAKEVAQILSAGTRRTGTTLSKFNPVFHFELNDQPHTFSSVRGHIFTQVLPPQCKNWGNYDNKKILTRQTPMIQNCGPGMEDLISNIQHLARGKKDLVLWLDCDRQGEAIAFEVLQLVQKINPGIRVHRARFSAVTPTDIKQAYQNLVAPNKLEADAVNYRIEIDFRMGCAFTRYQTVTFSKQYRFRQHSVLSYGPCQMPTLGFVVERYLFIRNFKPQKFWFISAQIILDQKTTVDLKWERGNQSNEVDTNLMFANMYMKANQGNDRLIGRILQRNKNVKKKYRPYPLTTVKFQKLATDKLKMSSAEAMKIAEKLYQSGYISYPRTETNAFPITINLQDLVKRLNSCPSYTPYVNKLLQDDKFMKPKVGNQNDQAHSPIHPVKPASQQNLTANEWKIYDLISRHFLACCSKDAVGIQSQILAEVGGQNFRASHLSIQQKNYLQIYPFERWVQSQFPGQIPQQFNAAVQLKDGQTQPPGYLTQSDLITLMQKNQIGTDATIHEHIETIQQRKYAVKANNTFKPTNLGASLIITYKALGLKLQNCHIRQLIEQRMNHIAEGQLDKEQATKDTLEEVIPIYQNLNRLEVEWLQRMGEAMREHQSLKKVDLETGEQLRNRLQSQNNFRRDPDQSNTQSNNKFICYKCGKPGHISTKCPDNNNNGQQYEQKNYKTNNFKKYQNKKNADQGDRSLNRGIVCYLCKQPGHLTTQCPNRDQFNKGIKKTSNQTGKVQNKFVCFICGERGHFAPTCPNKNKQNSKTPYSKQQSGDKPKNVCFKCNQPGHYATNCPNTNSRELNKTNSLDNKEGIKKICPGCGAQGRHPRGSQCHFVKRKKNDKQSSDNDSN